MRKLLAFILAVTLLATLVVTGCSGDKKATQSSTSDSSSESSVAEVVPDANPYEKLKLTEEEIDTLKGFWPIAEKPLEDQGDLDIFRVRSQAGIDSVSVNFTILTDATVDSMYPSWSEIVVGEWENDEYSAGPSVFDALINDDISTTCQLSNYGESSEIFLGIYLKQGSDELDKIFEAHWPIGLVDHEILSDAAEYSRGLYIEYEFATSTLVKSWYLDEEDYETAINYFISSLENENNYYYEKDDEYGIQTIECDIDEIEIYVYGNKDQGEIEIELTRPIE